jgi:hypothetical protein
VRSPLETGIGFRTSRGIWNLISSDFFLDCACWVLTALLEIILRDSFTF